MSIYICNAIPISVLRYCITIKWLKITSQTGFQANNCQDLWAVLGSAMSLKTIGEALSDDWICVRRHVKLKKDGTTGVDIYLD